MNAGGSPSSLAWVAVAVFAVVLLRNSRPRRLRVERLWVRPTIYALLMLSTLAAAPPPATALAWVVLVVAVAIGAVLGWRRGRAMRIEVHPETHDVTARASVIGMLFIVALLAVRLGLRDLARNAAAFGVPAAVATDALIVLAVAMMIASNMEMGLRARRLLAEARARDAQAA